MLTQITLQTGWLPGRLPGCLNPLHQLHAGTCAARRARLHEKASATSKPDVHDAGAMQPLTCFSNWLRFSSLRGKPSMRKGLVLPLSSMARCSRLMVTCNSAGGTGGGQTGRQASRQKRLGCWEGRTSSGAQQRAQRAASRPRGAATGGWRAGQRRLSQGLCTRLQQFFVIALLCHCSAPTWEGTIWPFLIISATIWPSGLPLFMCARSRSPALQGRGGAQGWATSGGTRRARQGRRGGK